MTYLRCRRFCLLLAAAVLSAGFNQPAAATPPTLGNILVTDAGGPPTAKVSEFTPAGALVQSWTFPIASGSARGIILDSNRNIQVYNGTFTPDLATVNTTTGASVITTLLPGWSTVARGGLGGVAAFGNSVFVTDMATGGGGGANGIIKVDINTYATTRYISGKDFDWVCTGQDGLLYALTNGRDLEVYDPTTMAFIRNINFGGANLYGVAVDSNGDVFAVALDNSIYQYDKNGKLIKSLALTAKGNNFDTIMINPAGQIAAVYFWSGEVFVTDRTLASFTKFTPAAGVLGPYVAWVAPPPGSGGGGGGGTGKIDEGSYFGSSGPGGGEGCFGFGRAALTRSPALSGPFLDGPGRQRVRNIQQPLPGATLSDGQQSNGPDISLILGSIAFILTASVLGVIKFARLG